MHTHTKCDHVTVVGVYTYIYIKRKYRVKCKCRSLGGPRQSHSGIDARVSFTLRRRCRRSANEIFHNIAPECD